MCEIYWTLIRFLALHAKSPGVKVVASRRNSQIVSEAIRLSPQ